jgi:integrase
MRFSRTRLSDVLHRWYSASRTPRPVGSWRDDGFLEVDQPEPSPLPKVRPHDLRRTFCSLLLAIGDNPRRVMTQAGHKTANLTLSIYAQEMDREDGESERLAALVNGDGEWRAIGTREHVGVEANRV